MRSRDFPTMPVLGHYVDRLRGCLSGQPVLYINHIISDSLEVARALAQVGAEVWLVGIPYGTTESPERRTIIEGFQELGPTTIPVVNEPADFSDRMAEAVSEVVRRMGNHCRQRVRSFLIVEDGGYGKANAKPRTVAVCRAAASSSRGNACWTHGTGDPG